MSGLPLQIWKKCLFTTFYHTDRHTQIHIVQEYLKTYLCLSVLRILYYTSSSNLTAGEQYNVKWVIINTLISKIACTKHIETLHN